MQSFVWNQTDSEVVKGTSVWKHITKLKETADKIVSGYSETNKRRLNFDCFIEVVHMKHHSLQDAGNYWIRLNVFLKENPNHTFTLITLQCNLIQEFPILLDLNYTDNPNPIFCSSDEELEPIVYESCSYGFEKMKESVTNYMLHLESQTNENHLNGWDKVRIELIEDNHQQTRKNKNSNQWTRAENALFVDIIDDYRDAISNKEANKIKEITKNLAFKMKKDHDLLKDRSERAIYEHLAYFDDLLGGIGNIEDYAKKDYVYYNLVKRSDRNSQSNPARIWRRRFLR